MSVKLKSIISQQLPEFVRSDHPIFIEFLKGYYEWLNQQQSKNLLELRDIDSTLDEYVQYFRRELDALGGEDFEYIDERLFLRKIKPLFKSKGTESAYKFLFKVLYDKVGDISYPWDSVLKASDGKWNQEMSIFIKITSGDATTLASNKVPLTGDLVTINVFVTRVEHVEDNIYEIFIDKDYYGEIQTHYTLNFNGVEGTIVPTTVNSTIIQPGEGYSIGDLIEGITVSGGKEIKQLLKVTGVDSNGGITSLVNISFGADYQNSFFLIVTKEANVISRSNIGITKGTTVQFELPDDSQINKYQEYGYLLDPNYVSTQYSDPTYVGTLLQQFFQETNIGQSEETNFTIIRFDIGAVAKYQGYYSKNDGFLDDDMFIQDSHFYQKYSYLVTVDEKLEKYKSLAKAYLHPAGTALFGEYQIQNNFIAGISGSIELGEWTSRSTFTQINTTLPEDYAYMSDEGGIIRIEPFDAEEYVVPEQDYSPPQMLTFYGDARNVLPEETITVSDELDPDNDITLT